MQALKAPIGSNVSVCVRFCARIHNICQFNWFLLIPLSGWIYQTNSIRELVMYPKNNNNNNNNFKTKVTIRNSNKELISRCMHSFTYYRWKFVIFFFISFHLLSCMLAYLVLFFLFNKTTLIVCMFSFFFLVWLYRWLLPLLFLNCIQSNRDV